MSIKAALIAQGIRSLGTKSIRLARTVRKKQGTREEEEEDRVKSVHISITRCTNYSDSRIQGVSSVILYLLWQIDFAEVRKTNEGLL